MVFTLKRPLVSRLTLLILAAIYIAVFLNIAYHRQVLAVMPLNNLHTTLVFLSMPLVAFSVINIMIMLASFFWLDRLLAALFILLSASAQFFIQTYNIVVDRPMITNMMDTTASESFALITRQLLFTLLTSGVLMALLVFWPRTRRDCLILFSAPVSACWNENDGGCKGACDRISHLDMTSLNLPGMCINGECYDDVLFHGLDKYTSQLKGNGVIVLHTIGSHGPAYSHRYPPQFRQFEPTRVTNQIQDCPQQQLITTYDNTLVNVDHIVDKAINVLRA